MSLSLDGGLIEFKDAAGVTRWSSADKNLMITNTITGSFPINAKNPSSGAIIQTETTNLGAVASNASVIMGHYVDKGRVFSIGGDRFYALWQEAMINAAAYQTWPTGVVMLGGGVWYRLDITGGSLIATVEYRLPLNGQAIGADTIQVRALIGGFEF